MEDIGLERSARVNELGRELESLGVLNPQVEGRTKEILGELTNIATFGHLDGCALGAVPACTCGLREAKELLDFYREVKMVMVLVRTST